MKLSKQISLGTDPLTGKRIRKRIYADTKAGLRQAEKDAIAEYARHGAPSAMTLGGYIEIWTEATQTALAPGTQRTNRCTLKHFQSLTNKRMSNIVQTEIQAILTKLWDRPNACHKACAMIRRIFQAAVYDGIIEKDVTIGLRKPKRTIKRRRPLTEEELEAVRNADFTPDERLLVDILLQFGLRPSEAFALDLRSFNRKTRMLTINKSLTHKNGAPMLKSTKTGVSRSLPIPDSFWSKLPFKRMYLFTNEDGQLLDEYQQARFTRNILVKINHTLEHLLQIRNS